MEGLRFIIFLKYFGKIADVDIDPLVITIRQTHILMTQVKLFLSTQEEGLLGNQNVKKKHLKGEQV